MFIVEYRTQSRSGVSHSTQFANIGSRHALSCKEAEDYLMRKTPNIEIVSSRYVGCL